MKALVSITIFAYRHVLGLINSCDLPTVTADRGLCTGTGHGLVGWRGQRGEEPAESFQGMKCLGWV